MKRILLCVLLMGCPRPRPVGPLPPEAQLAQAKERALVADQDQALDHVELASLAMAMGENETADKAFVQAVGTMQNFQADGTFRAVVGAESRKEWKGEPYEKMMAFLYLGLLRLQDGDPSNALAMAKSAILADTGLRVDQTTADFVPAYLLKALAYRELGEHDNAEKALDATVDVVWMRRLGPTILQSLMEIPLVGGKPEDQYACQVLLAGGVSPALGRHPRDPLQVVDGALSWASDARKAALDSRKKDWPEALSELSRRSVRRSFDCLEAVHTEWRSQVGLIAEGLQARATRDSEKIRAVAEPGGVVLWLESGHGPIKQAWGTYGQMLQIVPGRPAPKPKVRFDQVVYAPLTLDSVNYQATTRGGRQVDSFLQGKAVFKDTAGLVGYTLVEAGNVAYFFFDEDQLATFLYITGFALEIASALTNPAADTRAWKRLPDELHVVRLDSPPGEYSLQVGKFNYRLHVPDDGSSLVVVPARPLGEGATVIGEPCIRCSVPLNSNGESQ